MNPERSEVCAAHCYFSYIQTFLIQGLPRRLWLPWKVTKIKNPLQQLTEFLMNCTGGQLLVTSNLLSFSQCHAMACVTFSLSMARNMNCALTLLSSPVPTSKRWLQTPAMQEQALQTGGIFGAVMLLLFAWYYIGLWNKSCSPSRINKSLVFNTSGFLQKIHHSPFASQGYLSEWKNHQRDLKDNPKLQHPSVQTWTLQHSVLRNLHRNFKMETSCHPSHTHPSHFLILRQPLQTEILGSGNSQSIKSLNCTNYFIHLYL